jgi:hypothetical protein
MAVQKELGVHFTGPIKTGHKYLPLGYKMVPQWYAERGLCRFQKRRQGPLGCWVARQYIQIVHEQLMARHYLANLQTKKDKIKTQTSILFYKSRALHALPTTINKWVQSVVTISIGKGFCDFIWHGKLNDGRHGFKWSFWLLHWLLLFWPVKNCYLNGFMTKMMKRVFFGNFFAHWLHNWIQDQDMKGREKTNLILHSIVFELDWGRKKYRVGLEKENTEQFKGDVHPAVSETKKTVKLAGFHVPHGVVHATRANISVGTKLVGTNIYVTCE